MLKRYLKLIGATLLVLALSISLFACDSYTQNDGILDENYQPNPDGKIRLQYYCAQTEADKRSVNDWVASFQRKYPNITVETEFLSGDVNRAAIEIAAKSVGDVFFLNETVIYKYAAVQKVLMPLDYYAEAYGYDTSSVFSAIYNMGVIEGKLYMVMRDYNHLALIYNKDAVATAGLEDPVAVEKRNEWDWDTFKDYCTQLTTKEEGAAVKYVGANMPLGYSAVYLPFLEGWGGKWYDTENKKTYFVSDPKVLEGANEMVNILREGIVKSDSTTTPQSSYTAVFNEAVFLNMGSMGAEYENKGIDWDVVSWPKTPTHKVGTGATGFVVWNGTKNADAAAALCLSLYSEEGQRAYNGQEGGSVPNVKTLAEESFWRVPFADSSDDPEEGKNYNAWISYPEADTYARAECCVPPDIAELVNEYMSTAVNKAYTGVATMEDILKKLEQACNETWESLK